MKKSKYVARAGVIAALYAALTILTVTFLQGLAWGPVQFRISEAATVVGVLTGAAVPGLTLGCLLANLIAIPIAGTGLMGLFDVVFGTFATLLGTLWMRRFRSRPRIALMGPVLANALIVPAYLPLLAQGYGLYTIPFTDIAIGNAYLPMYLFGFVTIGLGEAVVIYILGLPLLAALRRFGVLSDDDGAIRSQDDTVQE